MPGPLVTIIGAGPYGLAAAAHLRAAGVDTKIFGKPMSFWEEMPAGMFLRSYRIASQIAHPAGILTLEAYAAAMGEPHDEPTPLAQFLAYGRWFAQQVVPDLDSRYITRIEPKQTGFTLVVADGEQVESDRVVVAAGIAPFARRPPQFRHLPVELVSHAADHQSIARFSGQSVLVVGAGQTALEFAALLHEGGANVEVIARSPTIHWLRYGAGSRLHTVLHSPWNPLRPILYPPSDVGPPGINMLVEHPRLWQLVPTRRLRSKLAHRAIRPAGAGWLRARLRGVPLRIGTTVSTATATGNFVSLRLSDGTTRTVNHVLLGTGYAVDVTQYSFFTSTILRNLSLIGGYPILNQSFESSLPGLHFLGAPAAENFGPLMRFVAGTHFAARRLTQGICRNG